MDLELSKVKAACKNAGCTVNDFISTVFSTSMAQYFEQQGRSDIQEFSCGLPFSLRAPISNYMDFEMNN